MQCCILNSLSLCMWLPFPNAKINHLPSDLPKHASHFPFFLYRNSIALISLRRNRQICKLAVEFPNNSN
uniref:Putative secreted protein n=1 Tax=Anopheles darlingi TaxID=43151 RepID=A0A2M4DEW8_ANODA